MISPQVVTNFNSVHSASPPNKRKDPLSLTKSPYHLKDLNIEALKKLLDSSLIWLNTHRAPLLVGEINLNWRLKWTSQCCSAIGKRLIWLKLWQRFNCTLWALINLIHIGSEV